MLWGPKKLQVGLVGSTLRLSSFQLIHLTGRLKRWNHLHISSLLQVFRASCEAATSDNVDYATKGIIAQGLAWLCESYGVQVECES